MWAFKNALTFASRYTLENNFAFSLSVVGSCSMGVARNRHPQPLQVGVREQWFELFH